MTTDATSDPAFDVGRLDTELVRDLGSTLATTVFLLVAGSVQSIVVARALGPSGKGLIALAFLVPSALSLLTATGFAASTVYFASRVDRRTLANHSYSFVAAASGLALAVVAVAFATSLTDSVVPGLRNGLLVVACLAIPAAIAHDVQNAMLQGLGLIRRMNSIRVFAASLALVAAAVSAGALNAGPLGVAAASLGATWLATLVETRTLARLGARVGFGIDRRTAVAQLRYAASDHVGGVVQYLNYRLDQFMVAGFLGARALGLYTIAVALAEMLWLAANAAASVVFPHIARERGAPSFSRTVRLAFGAFVLSLLGAAALALLGRWIIVLMYSDSFEAAYTALLWLLPGACVFGPAKIFLSDLAGRGRPGIYSGVAGIGLVLTIVLDMILVPRWGIKGAAAASSAAYIAVSLAATVSFFVVRRDARNGRP